ncbi:hypothetical protein JHK82_057294 [Glycine max]|nr:hypothetical protein JHK86_057121 [Glycine max]KAG4919867.1 hypothetical protein JHK85_058148 [Glycine max]KAG5075950.1 hypothetical protein JHK84_057181 [Glycine max]KAG5078599.1 hypothetical protein JHK82_057294 [Glycine max]KHN20259.1 hypothetical protein glysoja_023822 [Glycine soja]
MSHNLKIIFPLLLSFKAPFSASHPLILTLRLFLPSVSGIWDALTCGNNIAREALLVIRRGMSLFRQMIVQMFFTVGRDPWPVMREAYNMFIDGGDPEKLELVLGELVL